jgi:hypothetical protein
MNMFNQHHRQNNHSYQNSDKWCGIIQPNTEQQKWHVFRPTHLLEGLYSTWARIGTDQSLPWLGYGRDDPNLILGRDEDLYPGQGVQNGCSGIHWTTGIPSREVKRTWSKATSNIMVKNAWKLGSIQPYTLVMWSSTEHVDKFNLFYTADLEVPPPIHILTPSST